MKLTCCICEKQFERRPAEVKRCIARGLTKTYCSRKCCGANAIEHIPPEKRNLNNLKKSTTDELSPFRWHLRNCQRRGYEVDITLEDLKNQWDQQHGICPYTGWQLKNMPDTSYKNQLPLTPDRASLDRIDCSQGYTKGNVHFVAFMAQMAKHIFTEQALRQFCKDVVNYSGPAEN